MSGFFFFFSGGGLFHAPRLDGGGLIFFFSRGGLKEVNFKLRLVYRVAGYVAARRQIYSTCTLARD